MKKVFAILLFSYSFYGFSAVALAVECNLLSGLPLNEPWLYVILFAGTVLFYSFSYQYDPRPLPDNQRSQWIRRNRKEFMGFQPLLILIAILSGLTYLVQLPVLQTYQYFEVGILLALFPLLGMLYYGIAFPGLFRIRLRQFGWFKPFIIGLVWAGCVSFMPWLMKQWENNGFQIPSKGIMFLWLHNAMFISVIAILFDIKDYAADHNQALKTFVVRVGLRRVIFSVVLPLNLTGITALLLVHQTLNIQLPGLVLLIVPMLLLLFVAFSLQKKRSVTWYLLIIDGLMPVKALFGIGAAAMQ